MALFSRAQNVINATKIEAIDNDVDVATTIIGLARYSDDFIKSSGHSMISLITPMVIHLWHVDQRKMMDPPMLMLKI